MMKAARKNEPTHKWAWLLAGGLLGGLLLGVVGGLIGRFIGSYNTSGIGDLVATVVGQLIGITVGSLSGIVLMGYRHGYQRGLWLAIPGMVASVALVMVLADPLRLNSSTPIMLAALLIIPTLLTSLLLHWRQ